MRLIRRNQRLYEIKTAVVRLFLLDGGEQLTLIDTGTSGHGMEILKTIDRAGLDSRRLDSIIITHLHGDHTGSLAELRRLRAVKVYAHEAEADAIEEGRILRASTPGPSFPASIAVTLLLKGSGSKQQEGCPVDMRLKGDEQLKLGGGVHIIASPGHTKGHICCLLPREGILLTGDAAWGGSRPSVPVLFEDRKKGLETLRQLGSMDFETAYFSHGRAISKNASQKFSEKF